MKNLIFGPTGSGKTLFIKRILIDYIEKGKPFVYIYRSYKEDKFFTDSYPQINEIRANSFSQVKKIENIEDKFLVIGLTSFDPIQKDYLIKKVANSEHLKEHDLFIDESYSILTSNNSPVLERSIQGRNLFLSIQTMRDIETFQWNEDNFDNFFFNSETFNQIQFPEEIKIRDIIKKYIDNEEVNDFLRKTDKSNFSFVKISANNIEEVLSGKRVPFVYPMTEKKEEELILKTKLSKF